MESRPIDKRIEIQFPIANGEKLNLRKEYKKTGEANNILKPI